MDRKLESSRDDRGVRRMVLISLLLIAGCSGEGNSRPSPTEPDVTESCGPFGDWETSEYVLPYPVGTSYVVNQGNCSGFGHSGFWKHGYYYIMDIGTPIVASREGIVSETISSVEDYDTRATNLVIIAHGDGTAMLYSHLTRGGVLVEEGQPVAQGEPIGLSGVTGNTGGLPHLHQSMHRCETSAEIDTLSLRCATLPFNFSNTLPNPNGLEARRSYPAQ